MGVTSSYTMDMVYARTIKRRSGNGINASLRNVSDLMMASEASSSAAAGPATDEAQPPPAPPSTQSVPPGATSEVASSSEDDGAGVAITEGAGPSSESNEIVPTVVALTATATTTESKASIIPSNDQTGTEGDVVEDLMRVVEEEQEKDRDSLNNNGDEFYSPRKEGDGSSGAAAEDDQEISEVITGTGGGDGDAVMLSTGLTCQLPVVGAKEVYQQRGGEDDNLNHNSAFIVSSVPGGATNNTSQHIHIRNNNHLNNILNNNTLQPMTAVLSNQNNNTHNIMNNSNSNNQNNNWWAPPPVVQVQQQEMRNGTGKLSLLGSNPSLKFTSNGVVANVPQVGSSTDTLSNGATQLPKAILKCRPNSHPFQTRTLTLIPNVEMKVGRAVARHPVSEANAIFDCKVLSRNHAVLWYCDDKFYIRDTGSSNGTFVNNQRLSQTCLQSDKFEICSGDIVQFGVDVIENARKETHGCIVATIRLYLPDGRETKASQLTGVTVGGGAGGGQVLAEDLYRLHQYIQDAMLREQMLEVKMSELQRLIELAKGNVNGNWQAMVDEDRLLNRIDILEGKVHVFQKNYGEEKLREEMRQLQDDKLDYQHAAKDALRRVYQDRYEAVQKLSGVELALRMTEDEANVLRDKFIKSESHLNDTMTRLSTMQQKHDELQLKYADLEAKLLVQQQHQAMMELEREHNQQQQQQQHQQDYQGEIESSVGAEKSLQDLIETQQPESISREEVAAEGGVEKELSFGKAEGLMKLFANSDLKGSADIINSICNSAEEEEEEQPETGDSEYQEGVSVIERVLGRRKAEGGESEDGSEVVQLEGARGCSQLLYKLKAVERIISELEEGMAEEDDKESSMYSSDTSLDSVVQVDQNGSEVGEGSDNRSMASSTTSTLRCRRRGSDGGAGTVLTENMKRVVDKLRDICGEVSGPIRARMSEREDGDEEEEDKDKDEADTGESSKRVMELEEKLLQLERENESLAGDLADRPTMGQLEARVKLADDLQLELLSVQLKVTELREQLESSVRRYETLERDMQQQQKKRELSEAKEEAKNKKQSAELDRAAKEVERKEAELDERMLTNPMVEVEEELVLYKEKYKSLSDTNVSLQREMEEMRKKYEVVMQRSLMNLLMYMGPVVAVLGFFVLWPYL